MKPGINPAKTWFVVRTNIKCEAKAAENIRQAGFDCYLPQYRVEKKHRRTNTYSVIERPLMLRYLFVGLDPKHKHFGFVRGCEGVERLLEVQGEPVPVNPDDVLTLYLAEVDMKFDDTRQARIHRREEAQTRKLTMEMQFPPGQAVFVTDGKHPFADFHATVEEVTKTGNIKALVSLFGRFVPVEFHAAQLAPAA